MEKLKTLTVGLVISTVIFVILIGGLVVFDLLVHRKFDKLAAHNYRGYRGKVLGEKAKGEVRIGLFGGSVAMGYGAPNKESMTGFLQDYLDEEVNTGSKFTVINFGMNGEASITYFMANYRLFEYMGLDKIIFYVMSDSTKDGILQKPYCRRSANWIFRHFNYYFVFPTVLREKYYLVRYGDISEGYRKDRLFKGMDEFFSTERINKPAMSDRDTITLREFVNEETAKGKTFIFAIAPPESFEGPEKRERLKDYFATNFSKNHNVLIIDLERTFSGEDDRDSCISDGVHYTARANRAIAKKLLKYVMPEAE